MHTKIDGVNDSNPVYNTYITSKINTDYDYDFYNVDSLYY